MEPFYGEFLERLQSLHQGIAKTLEGLPQEAIDWVPGKEMNSLAVLVVHTAGAEAFLVRQLVAGETLSRNRDAEFAVQGLSIGALTAKLTDSELEIARVLEGLTLDDLARQCTLPNGNRATATWALLHTLDHTGEHLGHMSITRQLWEQQ